MGVLMAPITGPVTILGVTVYNPLPAAYFTDLDKECIIPIGGEIDPFDMEELSKGISEVISGGTLPNGVSWGITDRNADGFADIYVDAIEVTVDIICYLIKAGIVTTPLI